MPWSPRMPRKQSRRAMKKRNRRIDDDARKWAKRWNGRHFRWSQEGRKGNPDGS